MRLIKILFSLTFIFSSYNKTTTGNNPTEIKSIQNTIVEKSQLTLIPEKGRWFYKDRPFNGFAVVYHPNKKTAEKVGYFNGRKEGEAFKYFENGNIQKKSFYKENKLDRKKVVFWGNGNLASESNYNNGAKSGLQLTWFENGQLAKRKNLKEGKENGLQQAW
ncbi:MAG: antitoxin component YwqK of YwqJK toxin-antitoxin module, partial [Patiriisocius sp.]